MIDARDELPVTSALPAMASALAAAVASARERWRLWRVLKVTHRRQLDGTATDDDVRRHRMAQLALAFQASPGRVPQLPAAVDLMLATRMALEVERLVGPEVPGTAVTT